MLRTRRESILERNEQQENNPIHPQPNSKKPPKPNKPQQNNPCYLNYLSLELEIRNYLSLELVPSIKMLLIPTLTTVGGRFSF